MESYFRAAMERAMKVQEVMLQAMAKKITWFQAAEIIGISDRHMRRWRERYEESGFRGLFDRRRRGKPSPKRVPRAVLERVLELYREKYFDFNLRHFHEKLASEHQIGLSYSWVKGVLQGAGLVARGRQRGVHRKRRPGGRCRGCCCTSTAEPPPVVSGRTLVRLDRDFGRRQQRDLLRATGGGGIHGDGDGGIVRSDRAEGRVLRRIQRSRQPFLAHAEDGRQSGSASADAGGTGAARGGDPDDPGLLAQARGRSDRSFDTWQGRLPQELRLHKIASLEAANVFLREHYIAEFNRHFQVAAAQRGNAFLACRGRDLDQVFSLQFERAVNRDNTVSFQNLRLQIEAVRWQPRWRAARSRRFSTWMELSASPTGRTCWDAPRPKGRRRA